MRGLWGTLQHRQCWCRAICTTWVNLPLIYPGLGAYLGIFSVFTLLVFKWLGQRELSLILNCVLQIKAAVKYLQQEILFCSNFLSFCFTSIPWLWDEGQKVVTTADKADMQSTITVPGLAGDISRVAMACGTHCGCPIPALTRGVPQALREAVQLQCCGCPGQISASLSCCKHRLNVLWETANWVVGNWVVGHLFQQGRERIYVQGEDRP